MRAAPSATCAGGPLNENIYWEPEILEELPNGLVVGIRPQDVSFYYQGELVNEASDLSCMRNDTGSIAGADPSDYNDTARRSEYPSGGLLYRGSPETPASFSGWQCLNGSGVEQSVITNSQMKRDTGTAITTMFWHLVEPGGMDKWNGTCTGSDEAPGYIIANLLAPECSDRHNLRAPDGRGNFAFAARKADNSITDACPTVIVNGTREEYG